jgi:hypothetical protein
LPVCPSGKCKHLTGTMGVEFYGVGGRGACQLNVNGNGSLTGCIWAKILKLPSRAACEACRATWNLGTNSAFPLGPRKTTENLDRVGRSQDLPDAN